MPGLITRWWQTKDGHWVASVNFDLQFADVGQILELRDQLMPDYALRPRDGSAPLLGSRRRQQPRTYQMARKCAAAWSGTEPARLRNRRGV